jgi:NAD(P)-dependent dehydrogenase (short-subunit alcohol dehydrogenase family)
MSSGFGFGKRVVLITGASGALGSAVGDAFAEAGATVCDSNRSEPEQGLFAADGAGSFYRGDFTDAERVESVIEAVVADHGGLDVLCNIAGTWRGGQPIEGTSAEEFDFLFNVDCKSALLASKHAIPYASVRTGERRERLRDERDGEPGAIVSVSAKSSLSGGEGDGPYRISKAGVRLLTETIAAENPWYYSGERDHAEGDRHLGQSRDDTQGRLRGLTHAGGDREGGPPSL